MDVADLPPAPKNPLPYRRRLSAVRHFDTGLPLLCEAGGPVTRVVLAPRRLMPALVLVSSPQGARDVLLRNGSVAERGQTTVSRELRALVGDNLLTMCQDDWLPRRRAVQPIFTRQHVAALGSQVAPLAERAAAGWITAGEVDLDRECRALSLRALGMSVLGSGMSGTDEPVAAALRNSVHWAVDRAMRPVNLPRWWPTRGRRRAVAANTALRGLAAEILQACHTDDAIDAPLVRALIGAVDPETGAQLSDSAICDELVLFMLAGHETIAMALTYALYALGHHPDIQDRLADEVGALDVPAFDVADLPRLGYATQVLREAMRMCSPALVLGRMAMTDLAVDGYRVSAGDFVAVSVPAIHHNPQVWENPGRFDPDRFTDDRMRTRDRWDYLPFGAGQRACLGDHFALQEGTLALASIVSRARICALSSDFPLDVPLTAVPAAPVPAAVRARAGSRTR